MYNVYRGYLTDRGVFNARMHYHFCFANFSFFNIFTLMFLFLLSFHSNRLSTTSATCIILISISMHTFTSNFHYPCFDTCIYSVHAHTHSRTIYAHKYVYERVFDAGHRIFRNKYFYPNRDEKDNSIGHFTNFIDAFIALCLICTVNPMFLLEFLPFSRSSFFLFNEQTIKC